MFKAIAYLTLACFVCFSVAFLAKYLPYVAESYGPVDIYLDGEKLIVPKNTTRRLEYLN
jgi:hypothetical protein